MSINEIDVSDEEIEILDKRLSDYEKNREANLSWDEIKKRMRS